MEDERINKDDILDYSFYDDQHKLNVVINKEYLKKLFNADIILLDEKTHK